MKKGLFIMSVFSCSLVFFYVSSCLDSNDKAPAESERVSYNFQVRPIFSDKCFKCHGPDANTREAGLRLDLEKDAYQALKEHPRAHAIVPGLPDMSEVYLRISTTDTSIKMPPPSTNLPSLTEGEVQIIKKWITQGARYEPHWAFVVPKKSSLPKIKNTSWPKNEIDYFILQGLEDRGISPNEEADKERLLKRISFDLTGLPPSLDMMNRFLEDESPAAYEKMVNELMSSRAFGERMALPWLDVARYADSHGYDNEKLFHWRAFLRRTAISNLQNIAVNAKRCGDVKCLGFA